MVPRDIANRPGFRPRVTRVGVAVAAAVALGVSAGAQTKWSVVGWNNLGMHCMDSDYGVFSILPPYNTVHAQIVQGVNGTATLVKSPGGYTVRYRAFGDADGSTNRTSIGKTDFWDHTLAFFGLSLAPDWGLPIPGPSYAMPGSTNSYQGMNWETNAQWFAAYGVPITPYDDTLRKNPYPLMQLQARNGTTVLATNNVVLPVSDEMDCRACHGSGTQAAAQPAAGPVWDPNPERDYRLNILRRHDEQRGTSEVYRVQLASNGYDPEGLLATVLRGGKPILCARCHISEALPGVGYTNIPPLTTSVHSRHATVLDPDTGTSLNATDNRTACYRCHPGAVTRCLRGAMGSAIATNGVPAMQCQSCHGSMSAVGSPDRTGWFDEPNCQSCHTGTATHNNGQIRYTSVFASPGVPRTAVDATFATTPNTPVPNVSLYRFSRGHGGLYCEACHGSTHAEFPALHGNDNQYSQNHQGHVGVLAECSTCHGSTPTGTSNGGPHGLHPIGQQWVLDHHDVPGVGGAACQACHGTNERGTVLSRAHGARTLTANLDTPIVRHTWRGYQVSCYTCHRGSAGSGPTANQPPVVQSFGASTGVDVPLAIGLRVSDADGPLARTTRVVTQPANGTVALAPSGTNAVYTPFASFAGTDTFTYAAFDGELDSNLATVTVSVASGPYVAAVSPTSFVFTAGGGVGRVTVSVAAGHPWGVAPNHQWLSLLSPSTGVGPGTVLFAVKRTTSAAARNGSLTVAGQTVRVLQDTTLTPDTNGVVITAITAQYGEPAYVDYTTLTNRLLQLVQTEDLVSGYWLGVNAPVVGSGAVRHDVDGAATNRVQRFYRARLYP